MAASVHQRLLNHARAEGRPFNGLQQPTLFDTIQIIASFLRPVLQAVLERQRFEQRWSPGGPWTDAR
jgi:hypothetical protein